MFLGTHYHSDHSNYRLRDSINTVKSLIKYTHELGHKGMAITEHETIGSSLEALSILKEFRKKDPKSWKDYKLILGNEIYLCNRKQIEEEKDYVFPHFVLLAKDAIGHQQIRELSTRAWVDNSFTWVMKRVPTYYDDLFEVIGADKGHVIGSTACFRKGTQVLTQDGEKNIEDIVNGDYILNSYGKWERVNYPTSREYNGEGYIIKISGVADPIVCTEDHKFLTITDNKKNPSWVMAKELNAKTSSMKDILLCPLPDVKYTNMDTIYRKDWDNSFNNKNGNKRFCLPDEIKLTPSLMRMFGLFLGDGNISLKKSPRIGFTFNIKEYNTLIPILNDVGKQLNFEWNITKREKNHRIDISSGSVELVNLFYYLFKDEKADTKRIPQRLLHISRELDIELIFGYMLADGYFRTRKNSGKATGYEVGEFVTASISKGLSEDYYNLLTSLHITSGIEKNKGRKDKNNVNHKDSWYITGSNKFLGRILKEENYSHESVVNIFEKAIDFKKKDYVFLNNIWYKRMRIKEIEKTYLKEKVFCLNTPSHSFTCNQVIVHNCLGGALPQNILKAYKKSPKSPDYSDCVKWIKIMKKVFGEGNFYLELQPSTQEDQFIVDKALIQLSKETNTPYIITTD